MHIVEMGGRNFKCFEGEFKLVLEAKAYSILGQRADNPESSNWSGKSTIASIPMFVLYGRHSEATEDAWITNGQEGGECYFILDDGTRIQRTRVRGSSTKLYVFQSSGKQLMGKEAQAEIERMIGLSEKDSLATWAVEQRGMAQMIRARSSELLKVFTEWFDLNSIDNCRKMVADESIPFRNKEDLSVAGKSAGEMGLECLLVEGETIEMWKTYEIDIGVAVDKAQADYDGILLLARQVNKARDAIRGAERFDELVEEGKSIDSELKECGSLSILEADVKKLDEELSVLEQEVGVVYARSRQLRIVAEGKFDGKCPISSISCPAKAEINRERSVALSAAATVMENLKTLQEQRQRLLETRSEAIGKRDKYVSLKTKVDRIRKECESLIPAWKARRALGEDYPVSEEVERRLDAARIELGRLTGERDDIKNKLATCAELKKKIAECETNLEEARAQLQVIRETDIILDRARRVIAEDAISEIEEKANMLLSGIGIPLQLAVRWGREGSDIAQSCSECGKPFSRSAKEKTCLGCGAKRGANFIDKVDIVLSNRSGAAEDLAGWALQFAGADWLRVERTSPWQVAVLDEPLGSLDRSLRRAMSSHLTGMLSKSFQQAFVIAHSPDVLDSLPGRIVVTSSGQGEDARSKVEVIQ